MEVTFKVEDGMLVTDARREVDALGLKPGVRLVVIETSRGIAFVTEDVAEQMDAARQVIAENSEVLRSLAKSERMDMVRDIMDEYDEALTELAK